MKCFKLLSKQFGPQAETALIQWNRSGCIGLSAMVVAGWACFFYFCQILLAHDNCKKAYESHSQLFIISFE